MPDRVFKTAWFAKAARKARLSDAALLRAAREAEQGKADDLGGGVFKKRLGDNRVRSILLARSGEFWVYANCARFASWRRFIGANPPRIWTRS